jgi:hypothetical protein
VSFKSNAAAAAKRFSQVWRAALELWKGWAHPDTGAPPPGPASPNSIPWPSGRLCREERGENRAAGMGPQWKESGFHPSVALHPCCSLVIDFDWRGSPGESRGWMVRENNYVRERIWSIALRFVKSHLMFRAFDRLKERSFSIILVNILQVPVPQILVPFPYF